MFFLLLNIFLLIVLMLLFLLLSMVWPPDSPWAPFWATNEKTARQMCKLAKVNERTLVYDLGCGTGTAIVVAAKEFGAHCVGIEIDPLRFFIAWLKVRRFGVADKVTLVRENFFKVPLNSADFFFIYLIPNALKRLTPKLLKEAKPGAVFVSYVYEMPVEMFERKLKLVKHDRDNRIFMYRIN